MYSPHSDLYKMIHTPNYIVFSVEFEGKEYLGRPISVGVDNVWKPGPNQRATFQTYASIQDFMAGYIQSEIEVTSTNVIGLDAIDIIGREPLDYILKTCSEINNIDAQANIGIINKHIPEMLYHLSEALSQFEKLHNLNRHQAAYDDIDELIRECNNCRSDLNENERRFFITDIKEKVSVRITNIIENATAESFKDHLA